MTDASQTDFVVIFGLQKELNAFLEYFEEYEKRSGNGTWYKLKCESHKFQSQYHIVAFSLPQMGNYEASAATTRAIGVWNPRHIILGGIAGGFNKNFMELGDIVVAEAIIAYEPGKERNDRTERRIETLRPSLELIEVARKISAESWVLKPKAKRPDDQQGRKIPRVHFGVALSGEKIISDEKWLLNFIEDTKDINQEISKNIAAVDMEGYGVGLASIRADTAPGMLMAKSICDWANAEKNDDWQEYSAHVSACYIIELISSSPFGPSSHKFIAYGKNWREYSRRSLIGLCARLGNNWEDLSNWYDVPPGERRQFRSGRECEDLWESIEIRKRLATLPRALNEIGRDDLIDELIPVQ